MHVWQITHSLFHFSLTEDVAHPFHTLTPSVYISGLDV